MLACITVNLRRRAILRLQYVPEELTETTKEDMVVGGLEGSDLPLDSVAVGLVGAAESDMVERFGVVEDVAALSVWYGGYVLDGNGDGGGVGHQAGEDREETHCGNGR
jgi:hypothetical protein